MKAVALSPVEFPEARTTDLDFVIVGGGILGTAVAALASQAGYRVLVLRLSDNGIPRADTLRNQGWLQSGLIYPLTHFSDEAEYRVLALRTFFGGREMLRECGMPLSQDRGILRVVRPERIQEIEHKARLLRWPAHEFRRLGEDEAQDRLEELHESHSTYYAVPDSPFDEAGVLKYLRDLATGGGAQFVEIEGAASLQCHGQMVRICYGELTLESPLTLVVAGAGSLELMTQVGSPLRAALRRTPLLVQPPTCGLPAPILVDLDRGFSVVQHVDHAIPKGAMVIGTKVRLEPAPFAPPDGRRIPPSEVAIFDQCLHPKLVSQMHTRRFTAGYEVIPDRSTGITAFEPWTEDHGNVVFASPGRATLGLEAARKTLAIMIAKVSARSRQRFSYVSAVPGRWVEPIRMHYTPGYAFNDAEH